MRTLQIVTLSILMALAGCNRSSQQEKDTEPPRRLADGHLELTIEELQQLGVFIVDGKVMYNNITDGAGSLNIAVEDMFYIDQGATTSQTQLNYYPRYITTLDTVQRVMYSLRGSYPELEREVQRWQYFENLVPVIVPQKDSTETFGETLIFWFTRTNEIESDLQSMNIDLETQEHNQTTQ